MGRSKAKPKRNARSEKDEEEKQQENSFICSSSSSSSYYKTNHKNTKDKEHAIEQNESSSSIGTSHRINDNDNDNALELVDSDSEVEEFAANTSTAASAAGGVPAKKRKRLRKMNHDRDNCTKNILDVTEEKKEDEGDNRNDGSPSTMDFHGDGDGDGDATPKEQDNLSASLEAKKPDPELEIIKCNRKQCKTILKIPKHSQMLQNRYGHPTNNNSDPLGNRILRAFQLPDTSIEAESVSPSEIMASIYPILDQNTAIQIMTHYAKKKKIKIDWGPILPTLEHGLLLIEMQQYTPSSTNVHHVMIRFILTQKAFQQCSPYSLPRKVPLRRIKGQKKINSKFMACIFQEALGTLYYDNSFLEELLPFDISYKARLGQKRSKGGLKGRDGVKKEQVDDITAKIVYKVVDNVHSHRFEKSATGDMAAATETPNASVQHRGAGSANISELECDPFLLSNANETRSHCGQAKIPGLVPKLRNYQAAAVAWMLQRERGQYEDKGWELAWVVIHPFQPLTTEADAEVDDTNDAQQCIIGVDDGGDVTPLYRKKGSFHASSIFYNPFTGWIVDSYDAAKVCTIGNTGVLRGGILAESMGLGKTVEVLACILSNPFPTAVETIENDQSLDNHKDGSDSTTLTPPKPSIDGRTFDTRDFICFCGRHGTTKNSLAWVVCNKCHEPMHGQCAGFSDSADLLSATFEIANSFNVESEFRICDEKQCPSCIAANYTGENGLIKSRATLIVTPPSILSQWEREIKRHTLFNDSLDKTNPVRSLKVKVYSGVKEICNLSHVQAKEGGHQRQLLNPHFLADADIVLTTFPTLMADLGHSNDNPYATSEGNEGRRASRKRKRYRVVPSPLMSINWWRIALDEAQRVETPTAASARMALKLVSEHRWCVSGTPVGRGKMDDLYGLLLFLGARPFCEKDWFQASVKGNYSDVEERIAHMLQELLWRSTKANDTVRLQMGIPEQVEKKVFLQFSSVEKHFYQRQLEETILAADAVIGVHQSKNKNRKAKDTDMLSHHLHRLRAACCHPQVGASGIGKVHKSSNNYGGTSVANGVLSMSQILDRLIDEAKIKAEEAQRLFTLNTNAIACLYKLKSESGIRSGSFLDQDDEVALLQKSCHAYIEAIDVADSNSSPCSIVGEACLSGSNGFQSPGIVVRDGLASLNWLLHEGEGDEIPEVWSRFDFSGATKKITSIALRHVNKPRIPNVTEGSGSFLYPRDCVLQVSNAAIGGLFVDALQISLGRPESSTSDKIGFDWQQFEGFRPHKSKSWRILVKDYHPSERRSAESISTKTFVALEVQLMEPDIVPDSLQRLHILYNGVLTLSNLQENRNKIEGLIIGSEIDERFAADKIDETITAMRKEQESLEAHYIEAARVLQLASQARLNDATNKRREFHSQLLAIDQTAASAERQSWWQDLFAYCHFHPNSRIQSSLAEHVEESLFELYNDPSQPFNRRSFPLVHTLDRLNITFSMRVNDNSFFPNVTQNKVYACIANIHKLSEHPSAAEIFANSHCHKCRSDWDQKGPKCQCCKLEEELVEHQTAVKDTDINCILKSLFDWIRQNQSKYQRSSDGPISLKTLFKEAEIYFQLKEQVEKELDCAKAKWRTHLDLLSDIDELNQCKQTMRLAYEGENLYGMTAHEQAFIVQPRDIAGLIMDHTAKQAMAEGNLRRTKELLRYLKNQNVERMKTIENDSNEGSNTCCICLCNFEKERAVLRCGHTFHYSPCLERLFARGGGSHTITCPMRCAIRTKREDILIASDIRKDDGSKVAKKIEGQWGTKVDRLISDLLGVVEIGEKSIVFSQWDDMLSIMECAFAANSIRYVRPKSIKKFGDSLKFFRSNTCHVLLLHVKHGAEGLTLVEANHVFMIEPLLNYSMDSQAINRIHRIGQTSTTYIHRYVIEDTIEIKIDRLRAERQSREGEEEESAKKAKETLRAGGLDGGFNETELQDLLK